MNEGEHFDLIVLGGGGATVDWRRLSEHRLLAEQERDLECQKGPFVPARR